MSRSLLTLLALVVLGLAACSKTGFSGAGRYKVRIEVIGGFISSVQLEYWDNQYNNHSLQELAVPLNATSFTSEEYKVGKAINVAVAATAPQANAVPAPQVKLVVELLKNNKVIRKSEQTGNGNSQVLIQDPLPKE